MWFMAIISSQVFPLLRPMGDRVLSCITYVFQLVSVLFYILWIQFKIVKIFYIQTVRQICEMRVSVFEGRLVIYIYIYIYRIRG